MSDYFNKAGELHARATPFVVVTLVSARGHVPQEPGAKAIISTRGLEWGTIGGGKVEARAIRDAISMLASRDRSPRFVTWNLQRELGMSCGGEASFLFEKHDIGAWRIHLFGAGHVAQAVTRTLLNLDCHLTVIDPRPEWISKIPSSARLTTRLEADPAAAVETLPTDGFFVVMTRGHASDVPILAAIAKHHASAPYVGVMGSAVKARKIRQDLADLGVSHEFIARLRCPIGLKLGNSEPFEIALSVAAELVQTRDTCRGKDSLRIPQASCTLESSNGER